MPSHQSKHRIQAAETGKQREAAQDTPRRSGRLASKLKANNTMEQQAVELITKKCGTLGNEADAVPIDAGAPRHEIC
jgi:hypothetical protein